MSFLEEYHIDHQPCLPLRPTQVWTNPAALRHNLALLGERCGLGPAGVMAVVKANGYGHGMLAAARAFLAAGAGALAVGFVEEGILLRREGLACPILVMGGLVENQIPAFLDYDLEMTVSSLHKARQVQACLEATAPSMAGRRAAVHLKIDTGMERIGVHAAGGEAFLRAAAALDRLEIRGVYSHLANAEGEDPALVDEPLAPFLALRRAVEGLLPPTCRWHIANSAAAVTRPETALDLVRPGLLLYGVQHDPARPLLPAARPALRWTSAVVYFKVVEAGAGVSYGHLWRAPHRTRLATVPVGYGDGYPRGMTGRAEVLIRGRRLPVVGAICMDQLMVDLGPDGTAYNGDEVVLVGRQGDDEIRVEDLARWQGTIPYEILTGISERVPRRLAEL
ncbi:MAG: alanine racemase [bacterium]|nr:alanine racemase [bacterium]